MINFMVTDGVTLKKQQGKIWATNPYIYGS